MSEPDVANGERGRKAYGGLVLRLMDRVLVGGSEAREMQITY